MKSLVVVGIFVLVVLASTQDETQSCPEGMESAVDTAFQSCKPNGPPERNSPPSDSESSSDDLPASPPPKNGRGESPKACLIREFKEINDLKETVTECTENENNDPHALNCIMEKLRKLCPDVEFRGPPGGPKGGHGGPFGRPDGPPYGPPGGPRGPPNGQPGGPRGPPNDQPGGPDGPEDDDEEGNEDVNDQNQED